MVVSLDVLTTVAARTHFIPIRCGSVA